MVQPTKRLIRYRQSLEQKSIVDRDRSPSPVENAEEVVEEEVVEEAQLEEYRQDSASPTVEPPENVSPQAQAQAQQQPEPTKNIPATEKASGEEEEDGEDVSCLLESYKELCDDKYNASNWTDPKHVEWQQTRFRSHRWGMMADLRDKREPWNGGLMLNFVGTVESCTLETHGNQDPTKPIHRLVLCGQDSNLRQHNCQIPRWLEQTECVRMLAQLAFRSLNFGTVRPDTQYDNFTFSGGLRIKVAHTTMILDYNHKPLTGDDAKRGLGKGDLVLVDCFLRPFSLQASHGLALTADSVLLLKADHHQRVRVPEEMDVSVWKLLEERS